jgi:hypothetical protein
MCAYQLTSYPLQIASVMEEAWAPEYTYVGVIVDMEALQRLQVCTLRPI